MKTLLTILFSFILSVSYSQTTDLTNIISSWTQGKIDINGNVVQADVNRGGWTHLNITDDKSVVFSGAFTCGFGHSREGNWKIDQNDTTITFKFLKRIGYMNSPGESVIDETEVYKVKKLTTSELILTGQDKGKEMILPFIKTHKE